MTKLGKISPYLTDWPFPLKVDVEFRPVNHGTWARSVGENGYISVARRANSTLLYEDTRDWPEDEVRLLFWISGGAVKEVEGSSKVQISLHFMIIVICCNFMKLVAMILALLDNGDAPLITIGDAVSAFMTELDERGWGTKSIDTLSIWSDRFDGSSTARLAFLANAPQFLLAAMYMTFNAVFTCMATAREWNSLAKEHKGLRVSNPKGEQREIYFLQLPYRWALPLNTFGGFIHWLMSQAL